MSAIVTTKKAHGPKGNLLLGSALAFRSDALRFVLQTEKDFPDIARFRFAHLPMVFLSSPEYIRHILQTNNKNYKKGIEYEHLKPVLGQGLLTSEGDFWLRQRRLAQPAFHKERIASFFGIMQTATSEMMDDWQKRPGKPYFDLHAEMMHLALDIVAQTLLSTNVKDDSSQVEHALSVAIEESFHRVQALMNFPLWLPVPRHLRYNRQREILDQIVRNIIEERRKSGEVKNDLLDMLMNVQDEETGERMSDRQLRDEVMTIFLAGHETTANALSWTFYLLATHPEVERKFLSEVAQVLNGRLPTYDDLKSMPYTLQIIHESLRLFPPAWILGRTALADDEVDGFAVYKGDNILISPYATHRSEKYWDRPHEFNPERFTPEKMKEMHKFLYFPFGGGPRFCIGNNFALLEMQIILPMIAQRFKISLKEHQQIEAEPLITLRPKNGIYVKAEPR